MDILQYNELDSSRVKDAFEKVVDRLRTGDFRSADVKKLTGTPYYRARLDHANRLLFRIVRYGDRKYILLLEVILNHAYEKSRFLNGATVDETKIEGIPELSVVKDSEIESLNYINPANPRFHLLDKILSFDEAQDEVFKLRPPVIVIGSAGSGKTALTLEKLKTLSGDVLYVTLSPYLADNSRNLFYASNYENDALEPDFLSFRELIETIRVPEGRELTYRDFEGWHSKYRQVSRLKDAHKLFEEFRGVLTGSATDRVFLSREDYQALGVRQSIFLQDEREEVYNLFEKYLQFMKEGRYYDLNLVSWAYLPDAQPRYDFVVVDEVQDLTSIQLYLILKTLRTPDQFILCGDSNQIVHPNFFSWAQVKTLFYKERGGTPSDIRRILHANYRNSPQVTDISNRLLLIKNARFGSIDKESHYLIRSNSENPGVVELIGDDPAVMRELNEKTRKSAKVAVLVLREEDKEAARLYFQTPLVFSIQEAKGLEYESIVLFNFVTLNARVFKEIVEGIGPEDLEADRRYARARDKSDKSLEAYKFYINALYVAMTRAVRQLYVVEKDHRHRLFGLLNLAQASDRIKLSEQKSSQEDWEKEARKLDLQGKKEQADLIRKELLGNQATPWKAIDPDSLEELKKEAFDPNRYNKQAKQLLYEYALTYSVDYLFDELVRFKFNRALDPSRDAAAILQKYRQDYLDKKFVELNRKINLYGIDFRNPLNQTPLMIAAQMGLSMLVKSLAGNGANPDGRDNWGRTAFHIALKEAYEDREYALDKIGAVYPLLAPGSMRVKVDGRLIKLDAHTMEFFLLNSMIAGFQFVLRHKIQWRIPAFETADFVFALEHFPEPVIPYRRRNRAYITSVLARNEVVREGPYNRKLFLRVQRGLYLPNPLMEIGVKEDWVNVYDLIRLDSLEREKSNAALQELAAYLKRVKRTLSDLRRSSTNEESARENRPDTVVS
ncbi:MAG TPA: hypothetical protein DCZ95_19355 [Verrucomicrobia bacterium]|nr:MAG: hypothetical protein A2X46_13305 [Lentisphaerae bacterium GWF2_57_35]HBA86245.1 hypothetical protein [Verrucomicrobiota bacterium]